MRQNVMSLTEAFCGDRYHGVEARHCAEVNRIQGYLDYKGKKDAVDWHLLLWVYFAECI